MTNDKNPTDKEKELETTIRDDKTVRRIVLIVITTIIILSTIGVFSVYSYVKSGLEPVDEDSKEVIAVNIPLGSSSSQIADILEENNLINDARIFKFYLKFKNKASFQAGNYELTRAFSIDKIIQELQTGKVIEEPLFAITIPEGKLLEEIAHIFAEKLDYVGAIDAPEKVEEENEENSAEKENQNAKPELSEEELAEKEKQEEAFKDEFIKMAEDEKFLSKLQSQYPILISDKVFNEDLLYPLEGYLFAGTYDFFEEEPSIESILEMMIGRTNSLLNSMSSDVENSEFDIHEILTMASVIERESKFPEDRPRVSQVYINRIHKNMKLQSDITALYGLDHKVVMTYADLDIESPYNTYAVEGLPVGPINSPSIDSITAVLQPEGDDFTKIFYFSRPDGETFYSDTLDEHNAIKQKYRQEWYDLEADK